MVKKTKAKRTTTKRVKTSITMYHGRECPHCHVMMPLVDKLAAKEGIIMTKKEVWHNEKNANEMRKHARKIAPACGGDLGVPAFVSQRTGRVICGESSYTALKKWVLENK
jgi:glutaredoxin